MSYRFHANYPYLEKFNVFVKGKELEIRTPLLKGKGNITFDVFQNSYCVNVNKSPNEQINYGIGKDLNDESIEDAKLALQIKWYTDSFIEILIWR